MISGAIYIIAVLSLSWLRPMVGLALASNAYLFNAMISGGDSDSPIFNVLGPLICFGTILSKIILKNKVKLVRFKFADGLLIGIFLLYLVSAFFSDDMVVGIEFSLRYLFLGASFYFFARFSYVLYLDKGKFINDYMRGILITGFIVSVTALLQNNSSSQYTMRLTVGDSSTIPLAITLGQAAVVNIYYIMTAKGRNGIPYIISFLPIIYAFLAANTRSVVIGFCLALVVLLSADRFSIVRKNFGKVLLAITGMVIFIGYIVMNNAELVARLFSTFGHIATEQYGQSESERLDAWHHAIATFVEHPILGEGVGIFIQRFNMYPHNIFFESAAETGLVGLLMILTLIGSCIYCILMNKGNVRSPVVAAMFIFLFFVSLVSLSFWMHKALFTAIALVFITYGNLEKENNNF
ncbi:TPA: O-antigen ligase family protein [Raoultella ornithinolytica]|uniref:O-antigen ligase family protein n=1 Tax=Raoultella ornithinolytica TaxID=54291 RepID=UPI002DE8852F|nr:O-antigen ligase family protein [Raoultella ornithinolytica]MEC5111100.1 O-antigen ligase family protein [Raoultella ornithinolytica]HCE8951673.1 O-antigen ligase family protein [Raoultella ornithinolytica]